jgi:hypothetical protein
VTRVTLAACLRVDTHLGAWLFTVARNVHVSYRRSRAFEESDGSIGLWPVQRPASPFEQTAATELEGRIETALASLPVASREVLLLVGVEGMRPSEAAAVCGVSPDALRQRLKRARAARGADERAARSSRVEHRDVEGARMMTDDRLDPILQSLSRLPLTAPGAERDARIRMRCHAALTIRAAKAKAPAPRARSMLSLAGDLALATVLGAYAVVMLLQAFGLTL